MSTATLSPTSQERALRAKDHGAAARGTADRSCTRRVLMICQAFPPSGGPGVQRSAKFAKYLPEFGWKPVVWSADDIAQLPHDTSLLADLPDDLVHYARGAVSYVTAHRGIMRGLQRLGLMRLLGERSNRAIDWRIMRLLHGTWSCMFPDDTILWAARSILPLLRVIRRENIDAIFSTYSPVSSHWLGMTLQRRTGLPWVADFRDLWTDDYRYRAGRAIRSRLDRRLETSFLRRADAVTAVTPGQTEVLARRVPDQADKFFTVSNGVDTDDFDRLDRAAVYQRLHGPANRFVLSLVGSFDSGRVAEGMIKGLGRFARSLGTARRLFEFRVVGMMSGAMHERLVKAGIDVVATGYLPHDLAVRHMVGSDALVLSAPSGPNADTFMTGKVFEYLAAGRPILVVGPRDGAVQRLVTQCDAGRCVLPEADAVCTVLTDLWRQWEMGTPSAGCAPQRLKPFTRRQVTAELADVLTGVLTAKTRYRRPARSSTAHA